MKKMAKTYCVYKNAMLKTCRRIFHIHDKNTYMLKNLRVVFCHRIHDKIAMKNKWYNYFQKNNDVKNGKISDKIAMVYNKIAMKIALAKIKSKFSIAKYKVNCHAP